MPNGHRQRISKKDVSEPYKELEGGDAKISIDALRKNPEEAEADLAEIAEQAIEPEAPPLKRLINCATSTRLLKILSADATRKRRQRK